ncbi:hypothetical protein QTN25_000336 [Entamoeba marina]
MLVAVIVTFIRKFCNELKNNSPRVDENKTLIEKEILFLFGKFKKKQFTPKVEIYKSSVFDFVSNDIDASIKQDQLRLIHNKNIPVLQNCKAILYASSSIITYEINNIDINISIDNFEGHYNTQLINEYYSIHYKIAHKHLFYQEH